MKNFLILTHAILCLTFNSGYAQSRILEKDDRFDWIQTARIFLMDAYQPPFAPELEFDANLLAGTMIDMNANVIRIGTMGKYATIQGIRFSTHPGQGKRDLLQETIDACKPKGIKVIPYISTGHKLAWSMVTEDYPEYAHRSTPGGLPNRSHMFVGEDLGTICWLTPYRQAYLDYVGHVVRDYDIDAVYFDAWMPFYFWTGKRLCYCDGCRNGFRAAQGLEIPYHESDQDYTTDELRTIDRYHTWYEDFYINEVVLKVHQLIKAYKDVPLISNINNPQRMANLDPAIINSMDAFLYERGHSILERAEGISVPRSIGLHVWPYVGTYHNWPRLSFQGKNYQQEIFTNIMFGGGAIIAQPTGYIYHPDNREYVRYPFGIIEKYEKDLVGLENYPYVGVLYSYGSPRDHVQRSSMHGTIDARGSSLGAFAACLYNHIQVSSLSEYVLDNPARLQKYPVLFLPNVPYLSEERIENIKDYVRNGGSLIASCSTSLFDEKGNRRSSFAMEDLLKVRPLPASGELNDIINSYTAMIGGPNDLYLKTTKGGKIADPAKIYPMFYYEPVEVLDGGNVVMDVITGPDSKPLLPGIVMSDYGKGRVIYCSSTLESLFNSEAPDLTGELIKSMIKAVSSQALPYTIDAPQSLISNLAYKDNKMIFHLTNWTGNKFEKPWINEYYLAPVENVKLKISIPEGKKVVEVSAMAQGSFKKKINGQMLEVSLPKVGDYQGIIIELE